MIFLLALAFDNFRLPKIKSGSRPESSPRDLDHGSRHQRMRYGRAQQEREMSNLSKFVIFKPVPGGYVYRMPSARVFGSGVHLLVDDSQKDAIIKTMDSVPLFPIIAASWTTLSILFGTAALWAVQSPSHGLRDVLIAIGVVVSLYGALFISRRVLLFRLRPITAGLQTTDERITRADMRSTIPPVVLSPTRLRILKVCLILMPFILVSLVISRAVDMHQETQQPMLQALYDANANLGGLIIIFALGTFLFFGLLFIRRQWPGQKLS
jgi:hypothetical protein